LSCYFTPLPKEALLHLRGPDATSFLQGQLSCDIRTLDSETAVNGLYCTPQGRVICDLLIAQAEPGHLLLRLRRDVRDIAAAAFSRYIVFSRAELAADRDDWQVFALWGPGAAERLRASAGTAPDGPGRAACGDGFALIQVDEAGEQFECLLDTAGGASELTERLAQGTSPGEAGAWEALQIIAGRARIETAISGEYIPQMLNYDLTGFISFNKGCYTGQEVVARLHYRGKPKRRLYLASLEPGDRDDLKMPAAGTALYSPGSEQSTGNVINSVAGEDGQWLLLVTATAPGAAGGLHVGAANGPALQLRALPYPLPGN
jgi:folate-binding protein YgfZ